MNAQQFAAAIDKAAKEIAEGKEVLQRIALVVEGNAKRHTPVKTGTLRRSITTRVEGNAAYVGTSVEYAVFVHDGTKYMAGRPFLTEGLDDSVSQIDGMLSEWGGKILEKAAH